MVNWQFAAAEFAQDASLMAKLDNKRRALYIEWHGAMEGTSKYQ